LGGGIPISGMRAFKKEKKECFNKAPSGALGAGWCTGTEKHTYTNELRQQHAHTCSQGSAGRS